MSRDKQYVSRQNIPSILQTRRNLLGLSQQQVADHARIPIRQVQRLEAGTSEIQSNPLDICLRLCAALLLDPYELLGLNPWQPDISLLSEQYPFDFEASEEIMSRPKQKGRKPIRRDVMTMYFNHPRFGIIIPREVLVCLGKPEYIQILWNPGEMRFLFHSVDAAADSPYDVPNLLYERCAALVFPPFQMSEKMRPAERRIHIM